MRQKPPKWPDRFLEWFCSRELFEFIQGDIYELYTQRVEERGKKYANMAFYWDVLRFFRPSNFRRPKYFNNTIMIKNYLKVSIRSLRKNWSNSLINISGLTLALGCAITTFLFADFFFNLNSTHGNLENIYQVVSHIDENQKDELYGPSPTILSERMKEDLPEVLNATRVQYRRGNVKFGDNVFRELIQFADPAFFDVFDFPLVHGQIESFATGDLLISHQMAEKYFGNDDPINQRIDIKFGEVKRSFNVGGVMKEVPANTTFRPHIILNFDTYLKLANQQVNWIDEAKATFVLLDNPNSITQFSSILTTYRNVQNEANSKQPVKRFEMFSFKEVSNRNDIQDSIVLGNSKTGTIGIAVTGILLLIFACLNYVNIAISSAVTRLKEIGVRKVMGGSRFGIVQQFLIENFVVCAFAMVLGVITCYFLLLPAFNKLSPIVIPFAFSSLSTAIGYLLTLFVLLGFLSGSYPAFYISKFQTLKIFKGEKQLSGKNYFSRILLTGQFTLVFITILGCLVFTDNAMYVKQLSWGYEPEGILSLPISDHAQLEQMKTAASLNPEVSAFAISDGHIGVNNNLISFEHLDRPMKTLTYGVESGYLDLMNIPLLKGRYFQENEDQRNIVVNSLFVEQMQWDNPIGETFEFQGKNRIVVGVIADVFHVFFNNDSQRPMVFTLDEGQANFLVVKALPENLVEVNDYLHENWKEVAPFDPYVSYFQADSFDRQYGNVDANIWFMSSLSVITIFLSCLGLYGLLAFTLQNRMKEFGIRKVLGASRNNIILLANREFIWIMVISFGIGAPLGIVIMQKFVTSFFKIAKPLGPLPILIGMAITLGTILISVSGQMRRVTSVNPVDVLKGE